MSNFLRHLIRIAISVILAAIIVFFLFGLFDQRTISATERLMSGFIWIVFGFVKFGFVNTTINGRIVYHNLLPHIGLVSILIFGVMSWRARIKMPSRA